MASLRFAFGIPFLLLTAATTAALLTDPSQLPANKVYDYVVVGTGPGGSVVASRLSEDPNTNVLVIEAGPSDKGVTSLQIPLLAPQLQPNQAFDWNFTTVPQKNLDNRT
ncbi:hypothetical protein BD311DRAFT_822359 [Dichomitus squalens]|uniref:Uncharacterized protein n=1 Tax=Dichomitus squalens TaxID=114155 RepID=A0A4Q9M720_9APHY|nr:hypothetical protein BD311DRAFT_822359 [Dichomitus squalens]